MSRNAARDFVDNRKADIFQPEPVICGGITETHLLRGARAPERHALRAAHVRRRDRDRLGAAGDRRDARPHGLPLHDVPMLETGSDPNPWRTDLFSSRSGSEGRWVDVPTGPGSAAFEVDEAFVRSRARSPRRDRARLGPPYVDRRVSLGRRSRRVRRHGRRLRRGHRPARDGRAPRRDPRRPPRARARGRVRRRPRRVLPRPAGPGRRGRRRSSPRPMPSTWPRWSRLRRPARRSSSRSPWPSTRPNATR